MRSFLADKSDKQAKAWVAMFRGVTKALGFSSALLLSVCCSPSWGWSSGTNGEPEFVKATLIDQKLADAKAKLGRIESDSCPASIQKGCKAKFGESCKCFKRQLVLEQGKSETLYLTTHKETIVDFQDARNAITALIPGFLPPQKSYTGDSAPSVAIKGAAGNGFQFYVLHWALKEGLASAVVACPLEPFGGQPRVTMKVRDCYTKVFGVSRIAKDIPTKDRVSVDY